MALLGQAVALVSLVDMGLRELLCEYLTGEKRRMMNAWEAVP